MILSHVLNFKIGLFNVAVILPIVTYIINNLDYLLLVASSLDQNVDRGSVRNRFQRSESEFHYIIVGGGSAGCILANRLSENSSNRVLLLEAGGSPNPLLDIPTLSFLFNNKKAYDWAHRTVPQSNAAFALNNRVSFWPSGKALGGSSSINGLIYIRGNVQGYNYIANRTKDPMWRMENILKFYKKLENYKGYWKRDTHGSNGYLSIEAPDLVPFTKNFLRAGVELGYKIRDPNANGPHLEGFAPIESYLRNGVRSSAYYSPLHETMQSRPNLVVKKYSFVTRLLFRSELDNEVIGVEYEKEDIKYYAKASRETILSAGVLSTPKILMLSGIGPKSHLRKFNIPVRVNLPVGRRLQDKYGALIGPFMVPKGYSFDVFRDLNASSLLNWWLNGNGVMGSGRTEATFAILTQGAKLRGDVWAPDIHSYVFSQTPQLANRIFGDTFNFNTPTLEYMTNSLVYGDAFFQLVTLSRPIGTGEVKLKDTNPHSPLIVDPKYLDNPRDLATLVEGIRFAVNVVEKTKSMQEIGAKLFRQPFPGCESYRFKSDAYYECLAKHSTITAYKYCGTATIGSVDDPEAVVDSKFRVFGVKRLRVIDGSLLRVNEVNTNDVTVRMLGELGADVLLK